MLRCALLCERAGYMGHITYIANKLAEAAERSLYVSQQLAASSAWADFAAGPLQVCME